MRQYRLEPAGFCCNATNSTGLAGPDRRRPPMGGVEGGTPPEPLLPYVDWPDSNNNAAIKRLLNIQFGVRFGRADPGTLCIGKISAEKSSATRRAKLVLGRHNIVVVLGASLQDERSELGQPARTTGWCVCTREEVVSGLPVENLVQIFRFHTSAQTSQRQTHSVFSKHRTLQSTKKLLISHDAINLTSSAALNSRTKLRPSERLGHEELWVGSRSSLRP